jgi:CRISPR-associated exonuclease Cas4
MTDEYCDLEPISISALNQYVFCPRRCALMHIEGIWRDNEHTIIGSLLHDRADAPGFETGPGMKMLRALPLYSRRHGLSGMADIVELRGGKPTPVEYKKGKRRKFENDDIQLCAQAFCLEEMFGTDVPFGFIYHAASKRRREVAFDRRLRDQTEKTISAVRKLLASRHVPPAVLAPHCDGCSLRAICMPKITGIQTSTEWNRYQRDLWAE